jgi:hypothetical protein
MARPGPWDTSGTANSLADAIRRQAESQANAGSRVKNAAKRAADRARNAAGMPSIDDPLGQLMQQIQSINVAATPYDILLQQATGSAGAQYDPLIAELQAEMARTKKRGKANMGEARGMYNALASDIAAEIPEITNQMAAASKETEARYNQTQEELQNQYNTQAEQQAELFKKLGIQAAAPEASQQAMEDQAYFQNQSQSDEDAALALLREMGASDVSYNRQTASNTRLAGENTAQDIQAQLEDYLQTAGGKLSGLRAGRDSAIQAMLAQLQQQDSQRVAQQEETEYDRLMDMFNLQLRMQEMQNKTSNNRASSLDSLFKGTNGPSGAANYLGEMYGTSDTFSSDAIMQAIQDIMADPTVVAGKYDSGEDDQYGRPIMNRVNQAYLEDLLRKRMSGEGQSPLSGTQFSTTDINNAINALLAYQGKLR